MAAARKAAHASSSRSGPLRKKIAPCSGKRAVSAATMRCVAMLQPLLFAAANRRLFVPPPLDEVLAAIGIGKLDRPLKVLDAHLATTPCLLGNRFTVADLNIATVTNLAPHCGISLDARPRVQAWHAAALARPAATAPPRPAPSVSPRHR
jgi:glutathione S-transferase